jgi:hypothetical protein
MVGDFVTRPEFFRTTDISAVRKKGRPSRLSILLRLLPHPFQSPSRFTIAFRPTPRYHRRESVYCGLPTSGGRGSAYRGDSMLYHVSGCNRINGQEQTVEIEAPTPQAAEAIAGTHGIFVSAVRVPGQATPISVELDDTIDMTPRPPSPTACRISRRIPGDAPVYMGILVGVFAINVYAGLSLAGATALIVMGILRISRDGADAVQVGGVTLLWGVSYGAIGLFLLLVASSAIALRDSARNSYR